MNWKQRLGDWAAYAGIAVLAAAVIVPFARPEVARFRWWLVAAGVLLVLASVLARPGDVRRVFDRRNVRYGLNTGIVVVLVLALAGFVEAVSYRHNKRVDLTENRRHSLSPQTIQLLQNLKVDVSAVAFFRGDQPNKRTAEDLLKQYQRHAGSKFTWRSVDPDREPAQARRYAVESYGTIVLETKDRSEKVQDGDEEKLTNALVKLTRQGKRVVHVVQGHGERELASTERTGFSDAKASLERANYEVKPLALAREGKIPDDAAVVVMAGPRTELFPPEVQALEAYLGRGGKLLVMVDPGLVSPIKDEAVKRLLGAYGVELGENLVIEVNPIGQAFGIGPEVPIVQEYEAHPITRDMGGITTLFPLTRTTSPAKGLPPGVTVQALARTSSQSWGETDRTSLVQGQVKQDAQDLRGPVPVAAVVTKDKARIVVYGTSNLVANQFLNLQGNRDFFLNSVSWLAEEEDQISIRPKDVRQTPVFLSAQQSNLVFLIPMVVLPGLVVVAGIFAVVRRRAAK